MSGAPRTWRWRIASATAATLSRSRVAKSSGSARWSTMRTEPEGDQAMAWTGIGHEPNAECGVRNAEFQGEFEASQRVRTQQIHSALHIPHSALSVYHSPP